MPSRAANFKNMCCDNYHDDGSRGTGSVYFLRARKVLHTYLERAVERNRSRSFPLF